MTSPTVRRGLFLSSLAVATLLGPSIARPPLALAEERAPVALASPELGTITMTHETKGLFSSRPARVSWTDPRGVTRLSGALRDGRAEGLWVTRNADGRIASETRYVAGQLEGLSTSYYPNGRLARRASFREGQADGLRQVFEEDGSLREERTFKKGKMTRWRSRRVSRDFPEPRFEWDGRIFLPHQNRKYCRVSGRSIRCREPRDVWDAAESIRGAEFAADTLDQLETLHDGVLAGGAASGKGDILFACGRSDVYRSTPIAAGRPAKSAGFRSAGFTVPERDAMFAACDVGAGRHDPGLPGGSGGLTQGQANAVADFDRAIAACSASSTTGPVQSGGTARGVAALDGGFDPLPRHRQPGTPDWFRDAVEHAGFGAAHPLSSGGYGSRAIQDPDIYQVTRSSSREFLRFGPDTTERVQIDDTQDGWTITHTWDRATGQLIQEAISIPNGNGFDVTIRDYRNRTTTRISTDAQGNVISKSVERMDPSDQPAPEPAPARPPVPPPPPPPPAPPAPIDPADAGNPAPDPSPPPPPPLDPPPAPLDPTTPGAGRPDPEDPRSRCERAADSWARFRADCDRSGWQTFTCQEFLRLLSGCVSTALIQPTPDGGTACADQAGDGDPRQANCERRKRFEGAGGVAGAAGFGRFLDRVSSCAAPTLDPRGPGDICLDPRAQCRPDALFDAGSPSSRRDNRVRPRTGNGGR